ncbi:hypothetical protein [Gordonia sp. NB41Y]|uniref:hypothetical protein n=1 Tax=Gordonia sp. NB41Y TaxID=875808 RepID=UPI0002BF114E|nr:hypothetical protein [Gordonia sp. NB41Y]EMP14954.1 hypothetical protein ISGA_601 [Gordonia sp. NB41Y]WLP89459.1 hypothetical protein Q9K23_18005 [Gordonia sp. NB41Y]
MNNTPITTPGGLTIVDIDIDSDGHVTHTMFERTFTGPGYGNVNRTISVGRSIDADTGKVDPWLYIDTFCPPDPLGFVAVINRAAGVYASLLAR